MPRLRLWLLRHAQPLDGHGVCYGAHELAVQPADTHSAAQAFLSAWGGTQMPPEVWVSERTRAQDLAHALCAHWSIAGACAPRIDPRLNEFDFGQWEGVPWAQIPKAAVDAWTADFAHHRFGGQDSTGALVERVREALQHLLSASESALPLQTRQVVWVTHAGVIRAVNWLQRGQPTDTLRADTWPVDAPAFGQWQVVDFP